MQTLALFCGRSEIGDQLAGKDPLTLPSPQGGEGKTREPEGLRRSPLPSSERVGVRVHAVDLAVILFC